MAACAVHLSSYQTTGTLLYMTRWFGDACKRVYHQIMFSPTRSWNIAIHQPISCPLSESGRKTSMIVAFICVRHTMCFVGLLNVWFFEEVLYFWLHIEWSMKLKNTGFRHATVNLRLMCSQISLLSRYGRWRWIEVGCRSDRIGKLKSREVLPSGHIIVYMKDP
jgi:hypothetical protein